LQKKKWDYCRNKINENPKKKKKKKKLKKRFF
jgi:hypothetical protein